MLWIALAPFLVLAVAVALVPLVVGMVQQNRAGEAGGERAHDGYLLYGRERSASQICRPTSQSLPREFTP
jgi:hypothetical protein